MKKVNLSIEAFANENEQLSNQAMRSVTGGDEWIKDYCTTEGTDCVSVYRKDNGNTYLVWTYNLEP